MQFSNVRRGYDIPGTNFISTTFSLKSAFIRSKRGIRSTENVPLFTRFLGGWLASSMLSTPLHDASPLSKEGSTEGRLSPTTEPDPALALSPCFRSISCLSTCILTILNLSSSFPSCF
ncbi:unnamed protein product [Ectocarpus sp. 8 AP-2014]